MGRRLVGGWWGASVACLVQACRVYGLPFLFRASAQAKVQIPLPGRLHPSWKWESQVRHWRRSDWQGGERLRDTNDNAWCQL